MSAQPRSLILGGRIHEQGRDCPACEPDRCGVCHTRDALHTSAPRLTPSLFAACEWCDADAWRTDRERILFLREALLATHNEDCAVLSEWKPAPCDCGWSKPRPG